MNTTYFLNIVSGNIFGTLTTPGIPEKMYLGLSTTAPSLDGSGATEPAASAGYQRVELSSLSAPADGVVKNSAAISFPESTADWGTVTHFVVYDSAAVGAGNLLIYGELASPRTVEESTIMTIREGYLRLSAQNPS